MKLFTNTLGLYIVIFIFGILAYYLQELNIVKGIWDFWGVLDTSSAVALALLAFFAYYNYTKEDDVIKIYFEINGDKIDSNLSLLRKEFSRSEILGLLGMIQKDQEKRFKLAYFQNPEILKAIQKIQKGEGKEFTIKLQEDEKRYFNFDS